MVAATPPTAATLKKSLREVGIKGPPNPVQKRLLFIRLSAISLVKKLNLKYIPTNATEPFF
jgi:hypothetical protein